MCIYLLSYLLVLLSCQYLQFDGRLLNSFFFLYLFFKGIHTVYDILSRVEHVTPALTRLKPVWNDRSISLSSKIRLMDYLVTSIFLYACESWTLTAELQRRIQAMEMRCYRKKFHMSYKDHVSNEEVRAKIHQAFGPHEDLLMIVKRQKLQ